MTDRFRSPAMLLAPSTHFAWLLETTTGRPASNFGATVTPGQNAKGSWAQLIDGGSVPYDVWRISVHVNSNDVTTAARNTLLDIGIDPAGGTSYTTLIPDLLVSCAAAYSTMAIGVHYVFPLFIPAGSSIAARASVNNATVGTLRCHATLQGRPAHPELVSVGRVVQAIGITAGTSSGTSVTSGTTSEGSWTSLGTLSRDAWWWQLGFGVSDGTMTNVHYGADLSAGSAGQITLINDQRIWTGAAEQLGTFSPPGQGEGIVAAGATVYGRLQCSGTADASLSMAAYAVSGGPV